MKIFSNLLNNKYIIVYLTFLLWIFLIYVLIMQEYFINCSHYQWIQINPILYQLLFIFLFSINIIGLKRKELKEKKFLLYLLFLNISGIILIQYISNIYLWNCVFSFDKF